MWNNRDINIENKSVFWKAWRDKNVLFVQDLLNNQGNYLSPQEFRDKYNIKVNFLQYYQITSAIPAYLKSLASAHMDLEDLNSICENFDFQLSKDITLNLKKTPCKQFYKLFVEKINTEPTAIKSWRKKNCSEVADNWVNCIQNNYKITRDNKLRQFYFKLLHRILVTNKELKRFGITDSQHEIPNLRIFNSCVKKASSLRTSSAFRIACVADETKPRYSPSANQRPKACSAPRVLPVLSIIGSNWL